LDRLANVGVSKIFLKYLSAKIEMLPNFLYTGVPMIKNITAGFGLAISGSTNSDPYISPGSAGAGMMRWNPNMSCIEVNDGSMWKQITWSYPTVELDHNARTVMNWAMQKMQEDSLRQQRIRDNPALQKAYEAIKRAEANFDILDKIAGEERTHNEDQVQSSP